MQPSSPQTRPLVNGHAALSPAEAQTLRQLRLLEAITSTTPDFQYVFDRTGRFQYANPRLLEVWGMTLAEIVGKTCRELGYEQWHHDMHMREIVQVIETKAPIKGEVPFRAPLTGTFGIYEYIFTPVLGTDGRVEFIAGTTRDVTGRHAQQEQHRRDREKLQVALDAAELGTWTYRFEDNAWDLDDRGAQLYNTHATSVIHDQAMMNRIMHDDDIPLMWERVRQACDPRGDGRYIIEYRIRQDDGSFRWVAAWARVEFEGEGQDRRAVRMRGASRDITARRHAEEALRLSEERYRGIFEQSVAGIAEVDPSGRFTTVNDRYCTMVGYSRQELLALRMQDLTHPDDLGHNLSQFSNALATGQGFEIEKRYRRKDGRDVWVHNSVFARRGPTGQVEHIVAVCVDVTQRRLAELELDQHRQRLEHMVEERTAQLRDSSKRLRDSERLASLGTLTAGLGHDLHNALLPLRIHVQELAEAARRDPSIADNAAAVEAMTLYLSSLSRGMQLLSRDPEQPGRDDATDLEEWCQNAHRVLGAIAGRSIDFTCTVDKDTPRAAVADHRLTQAVFNLVQNARDAIVHQRGESRRGSVRVHARPAPQPGWVEITVTDDGPGMDETTRRRCLEPFFTTKVRGSLTGDGGTGMGLALVNGIVSGAGGRVEIDTAPGRGSTFRLLLPVAPDAQPEPVDVGSTAALSLKDRRRAAAVQALLTAWGWSVRTGEHDDAALWVTEPDAATPDQVRAFIEGSPDRRVLLLTDDGEAYRAANTSAARLRCSGNASRNFYDLRREIEALTSP